ncbi:NYN domain-containing protein [Planococcus sp. FY231025]|uniref:NYN domain-containing protein n=1 Tax=Planococcus sp. FY231025 TaxID=3455699 RepID=UPI003F8F68FE
MKKVAIIVDGQFLLYRLKDALQLKNYPDGETINTYLKSIVEPNEDLYRIFFYQGEPSKQKKKLPISKKDIDFKDSDQAAASNEMLNCLAKKELMAVRLGETRFRGWKLKDYVQTKIERASFNEQIADDHFYPDFQQKGVDIKIGLDVAWLASNNLVDMIILVTGDSDFVPAMKFARREGIQVAILKIGPKNIHESLEVHSDFIKEHTDEAIRRIFTVEEIKVGQ